MREIEKKKKNERHVRVTGVISKIYSYDVSNNTGNTVGTRFD